MDIGNDGGMCASVARRIVAASGRNVLDDYFTFYQDGKWLVEVVRRLLSTVDRIEKNSGDALALTPKMDECVRYVSGVSVEEMGSGNAAKEIKGQADALSGAIDSGDAADVERIAKEFGEYLSKYEESCVNVMRNRYVDDERNVSGLLKTIRESGNYVMNRR